MTSCIADKYMQQKEEDLCIRCGSEMVHIGFKIYRCKVCGHEEKPEDIM